MLKSMPVIFAIVAVFFTLAFPTPQDALKVARIVPPERQALQIEGIDTGPNVVALAANTPMEPVVSRIEATGCLDLLPDLPADLVQTCSTLIADAVIEIAVYEGDASYDLSQQNALLVERLRLAAAKVCRSRWVSEPGISFDLDDPVCEVSTINLASLQ